MASPKKKKKAENGHFTNWKGKDGKMVGYFFTPGDRYSSRKRAFKMEEKAYK